MTDTLVAVPTSATARTRAAAPTTRPTTHTRPGETEPSQPDIVEVWGKDSFPASDAPANW